jgi:phosphoenolpyruvate---glycerone phosphotransferase subunit DhaL
MTTEAAVEAGLVTTWMREVAASVQAESAHLTQLDAAIGDGDHGVNMERGFTAVEQALAGQNAEVPPGQLLILCGKTIVSTVGGASGPLWGTALRHAGRSLGDAESFDSEQLTDALQAAVDGIVELGAAAPGDKTMIDALTPAVDALREAVASGQPLDKALAVAADAAEQGARATVPMQARKGRASYLGERSIGHQDPGATSSALIVRALERAVANSD